MKATRIGLTSGLVTLAALLAFAGRAPAIPAFSRQLNTKCSTCHTPLPPRLNNVGIAFRRMGWRLPDEKEGKLIFKDLPARNPFDTTSLIVDFRARDTETTSEFSIDEFDMFSAGNLGPRASYLAEFVVAEGESMLERGEGQVNVGTPERSFILRAGRIAPLLWEKGNHQNLGISRPLIFSTMVPSGSFGGFVLAEPMVGVEVGGALNHLGETGGLRSTFAAASVFNGVNSEGEPINTDDNRAKDTLVQVVHLWSETNSLAALWYHGTATGMTEGDPPVPFRDRFNRFIVAGNMRVMGTVDVLAGWMHGTENSTEVGRFSSRGYYVEVAPAIGKKAFGMLRWDNFHGGDALRMRGWTVGFGYQAHANFLLNAEYQRLAPGDVRDVTFQVRLLY